MLAGNDASEQLRVRLSGLLRMLALMQAFDCVQSLMQGVIQVSSLQTDFAVGTVYVAVPTFVHGAVHAGTPCSLMPGPLRCLCL